MFPEDVIDRAKQILVVLQSRAVTFNVDCCEGPNNKNKLLLEKLKDIRGLSNSNARIAMSLLAKQYGLETNDNLSIDSSNKNDSVTWDIESQEGNKKCHSQELGLTLLSESVRSISVDIVEHEQRENNTQNSSSFSLIIEMQRNLKKKRKTSEISMQQN